MGFVGKVMDGVSGIEGYYTLGILIFIAMFFVILIRTIRMRKTDLVKFKTDILDNEEALNQSIE